MAFSFRKSSKNKPASWQYYKSVPFTRLRAFYGTVFCLFAITGFFETCSQPGPHALCPCISEQPYAAASPRDVSASSGHVYVLVSLLLLGDKSSTWPWLGFSVNKLFFFHRAFTCKAGKHNLRHSIRQANMLPSSGSFCPPVHPLSTRRRTESFRNLAMSLSLHTAFRRRLFLQSHCATAQFELYGRSDP